MSSEPPVDQSGNVSVPQAPPQAAAANAAAPAAGVADGVDPGSAPAPPPQVPPVPAPDAAQMATDPDGSASAPAADTPPLEITEEAVVALIAERDEYLDALQRLKAEFANSRRRASETAGVQRQQAAADLVTRLLPVLDSAQAALDQGVEQVRPLKDALFEALKSQGLELMDPQGQAFDPQLHEAVMFESGEGPQVVIETLRFGYLWNSRVIRPAMVKVRG